MFVEKDPKIKLFGKTIDLPEAAAAGPVVTSLPVLTQLSVTAEEDGSHQDPPCSSDSMLEDRNLDLDAEEQESTKSLSDTKQDAAKDADLLCQPLMSEELIDSNRIPPITEDSSTPSADDGAVAKKNSKTEEDQSGAANSQDKTLKKPDKILPCPRCNSMETKFCYFNNYNVNQPRHFCKNCHRYWTAGGTMRNVPVGAGRRKNKNTVSQFRHLTVQEALQCAQVDIPNVIHPAALNPSNGTVLTFNSDSPLCESMASALNIADESIINSTRNGFHMPEVNLSVSHGSKVNRDDPLVGTFTSTASSTGDRSKSELPETNFPPVPPQVPFFPGAPWPFPWHSDPWSSQISPHTFSPASFPVPFFSTTLPYWGCAVPSAWNVPWVFPSMPTTIQCDTHQSSTGQNSPTLGKHSRDENLLKSPNGNEADTQKESSPEKSLWIPKTLRIDDPEEAAKSSIWETLGIKHDSVDFSPGGARLFKTFQSQSNIDEKSNVLETSSVLNANPAALSRALTFQESS